MKNLSRFFVSAATFALALFALPALAAEYHVTTNGSSSGNGSIGSPWSLSYALKNDSQVQGGDTIWVHGGTYYGQYTSGLKGSSGNQILVRNFNGERATLDGVNGNSQVLLINSSYTTYMGLEIMNSGTDRVAERPGMPDSQGNPNSSWPYPDDMSRGDGIQFSNSSVVPGNKIVNMIIHDTRQGISVWAGATSVELYGNLVYNDGWQSSDRGHGHGLYAQNTSDGARRTVSDNIFWGQFSHGAQVYGSDAAYIDNYSLIGNVSFGHQTTERGLLIGGGNVGNRDIFDSNMVYNDQVQLGQYAGLDHATVRNNYIISNTSITAFRFQNTSCGAIEAFTGNTIIGSIDTSYCNPSSFSGNNINGANTGLKVFVRKNAHEVGRANITIFNPSGTGSVSVDLTSVGLASGEYQLHNAENYYGDVIDIDYSGSGPISIPMSGHSRVPTIGYQKWSFTTFPYFGSFILTKPGATQSITPGSCASTNSCGGSGSVDTIAPTMPQGQSIFVSNTAATSVSLSWGAATDNVGVSNYRVYRDEVSIANPTSLTYTNTGLSPSTKYSYAVSARDAQGNESVRTASVSVTTLAAGTAPDATSERKIPVSDTAVSNDFAVPSPVMSLAIDTSGLQRRPLYVTLTSQNNNNHVWPVVYVSVGNPLNTYCGNKTGDGKWCIFSNSGIPDWNNSGGTKIEIPLTSLSSGLHYIASWDWTWDGNATKSDGSKGCYKGPGLNTCDIGKWRLQKYTVQ